MSHLLSICLLQKGSPKHVLIDRGNKEQLPCLIHRQLIINHHVNPFPEVPELSGERNELMFPLEGTSP